MNPSSLKGIYWLPYVRMLQIQSPKPSISSTWSAPDGQAGIIKGVRTFWKKPRWQNSLGWIQRGKSLGICFHFMSVSLSSGEYAVLWESLIMARMRLGWKPREQKALDRASYSPPSFHISKACIPSDKTPCIQAVRGEGWGWVGHL